MSTPTISPPGISAEEVARRVAEYRRLGFQRQAPAHIVYHEEHRDCPWANCELRIAGINFRLELQGDAAAQAQWLAAWWQGSGLVARCPKCGRPVLFGMSGKRAVSDPMAWDGAVLPDDWHQKAQIVTRSE